MEQSVILAPMPMGKITSYGWDLFDVGDVMHVPVDAGKTRKFMLMKVISAARNWQRRNRPDWRFSSSVLPGNYDFVAVTRIV